MFPSGNLDPAMREGLAMLAPFVPFFKPITPVQLRRALDVVGQAANWQPVETYDYAVRDSRGRICSEVRLVRGENC